MSRKTTLQQIADAADVSLSTVDRVLNRRGGVSSDREAKVLEWANRLNVDRVLYRSHVSMVRVAVIMQSPQNPFYRGLRDAFADLNAGMAELRMTCFIHYVDVGNVTGMTGKIAQIASSFDALVVICPDHPRLSAALHRISTKIPIVTLATDLPGYSRIAYVGPDNRQTGRCAGELMGRFLGPVGGEVLVVLGLHGMVGHAEREAGFRAILRERFSGYDCTREVPFFIEESAIRTVDGGVLANSEALLSAFDCHRERIFSAAIRAYGRRREGSYTLTSSDF